MTINVQALYLGLITHHPFERTITTMPINLSPTHPMTPQEITLEYIQGIEKAHDKELSIEYWDEQDNLWRLYNTPSYLKSLNWDTLVYRIKPYIPPTPPPKPYRGDVWEDCNGCVGVVTGVLYDQVYMYYGYFTEVVPFTNLKKYLGQAQQS